MFKQLRSFGIFILTAAIVLSCIPVTAFATPQTHPNTHVNTGDQRADIIAVALTQVGYMEGANNDTKYGVWYGYNNLAWCGIFVAWCADQAGVPTSVLARTGVSSPAAYGLTTEPEGYVPLPGDLFFSKNNSHVGLVYYVDGDYFYSLEGNTWENGPEGVYCRRHELASFVYASPNYQGGGNHNYAVGSDSGHPHKEFYSCTDCGDKYYTGKTVTRSDCQTCVQNSCSHSYGAYSQSGSQHTRICSLCGKQETSTHSWNLGTTVQTATCSTAGSKLQKCQLCGLEQTAAVSATGNHSFSAWTLLSEQTHSRKCASCGKQETAVHSLPEKHHTDEKYHWFSCGDCDELIGKEEHLFGDDCDSACSVCGYVRPDGHRYSEDMLKDDNAHWRACEVCGLITDRQDHEFSASCDEICNICGYQRLTQHSFQTEYSTDSSRHWFACAVCGQEKETQDHVAEAAQRQGAIQRCTVCQLVLTDDTMHTHGFDTVYSDETHHWGVCSCGIDMKPEAHSWSVRTETCSVCGQSMPDRQTDNSDLLPWIAGGAGILALGVFLLILLLRKRK